MPFLYHRRPPELRGDVLYPLNTLRELHPDLYEDERAKYDRRESLLELRIPILDVLWNDALHLSPFHPARVAAAWRDAGLSPESLADPFFQIPVERIDHRRAVWFPSGALPLDDVAPFDRAAYREPTELPAAYVEHVRRRGGEGRRLRAFAHLPHVLVAAPVDVTGLAVVTAESA